MRKPNVRLHTTRVHHTGFGLSLEVPHLNHAGSIVLAYSRTSGGLRPFGIRLPHQVYLRDAIDWIDRFDAVEIWALPVGVPSRWVQLVGTEPGATHPRGGAS